MSSLKKDLNLLKNSQSKTKFYKTSKMIMEVNKFLFRSISKLLFNKTMKARILK